MESRERVIAAMSHEKPDRVPADIWAEPGVWERLRRDTGSTSDEEVRRKLEIDVRYLSPRYPPDVIRDGVRENPWGERWEQVTTCYGREWEHTRGALHDAKSLDEVRSFPWPRCDEVDYSGLAEQAARFAGYALFYGSADFFERPGLVRGLENILVDVLLDPDLVTFLQEQFLSYFIEDFTRAMEATGGRIDVFLALTDLGTQERLIMGRETMERFVFAPLRRLAGVVHREGVKLMFHTCGSVREVIPDLIDCGVDILNPLQPRAKGMEAGGLKRDFGGRLGLHGGIDIQYLLPLGTAGGVAAEAERLARLLGENGGYVLAPSHNIQLDTPTANILAMYRPEARRI